MAPSHLSEQVPSNITRSIRKLQHDYCFPGILLKSERLKKCHRYLNSSYKNSELLKNVVFCSLFKISTKRYDCYQTIGLGIPYEIVETK